MRVTYYVNLNMRNKILGFQTTDLLVLVDSIEISAANVGVSVDEIAEITYMRLNRIDSPVPVLDENEAPSMSVGDVIELHYPSGSLFMTVADVGFRQITPPQVFVPRSGRTVREVIREYRS